MKSLDINAEPEDLELSGGSGEIRVTLYYEEDIEIYINEDYNWLVHTFEFDIDESAEVSSSRRR